MLEVTDPLVDRNSWQPIVGYPKLTMRQGDRDSQEDELVARLLAPLCSSGGRRWRTRRDG